ncbi:MAG: lysophospholipid acyltransferase family protein [Chitinophagaceae bacterium]|nr:lysophospholipid acyltransferase family protein [Oligoflexus sp.]
MLQKLKKRIICFFAYMVVGLLYLTYRFRWIDLQNREAARALHPNSQVAVAIWHRNSIGCLLAYAWKRMAILISLSFDGEVIAYVARRFGIHSARGSSSRGGIEAMKQLLTHHKQGYDLGITVDGPRGPRYQVKPGIIAVAARTGMPILPFAAVARREWVLHKAWDHFRIPKPFSEILCLYGQPIAIPRTPDNTRLEDHAALVAKELMALEETLRGMISGRGSEATP